MKVAIYPNFRRLFLAYYQQARRESGFESQDTQ